MTAHVALPPAKLVVVDTATLALYAALMSQQEPLDVVIELKTGIDQPVAETLYRRILSNAAIRVVAVVWVDPIYFAVDKSSLPAMARSLLRLYRMRPPSHIAQLLDGYQAVAGSVCSTLLSCVFPLSRREQIEHGTGDYLYRGRLASRWGGGSRLRRLLRLPAPCFAGTARVYTMAYLDGVGIQHCDYRRFRSDAVSALVGELVAAHPTLFWPDATLFLPVSAPHSASGSVTSPRYDDFNLALAQRATSPGSVLLVKFHPSTYQSGEDTARLLARLAEAGFQVVDIAAVGAAELTLLPAEVLLAELGIRRVVCVESSVLWNVMHVPDVALVSGTQLFAEHLPDLDRYQYFSDMIRYVPAGRITRL